MKTDVELRCVASCCDSALGLPVTVASALVLFGTRRSSAARHSCLPPKSGSYPQAGQASGQQSPKDGCWWQQAVDRRGGIQNQEWWLDGWIEPQGRSHAGGGGGTDRKTQRRQTDAPSVDKLGYERPVFTSDKPGKGKKFHSYLTTQLGWTVCTWPLRKMFWIFIIISLCVFKVFDIFNVLRLVSRQSEEMLCRDPNRSTM